MIERSNQSVDQLVDKVDGVALIDPSSFYNNGSCSGAFGYSFDFELYSNSPIWHDPIDPIEISNSFSLKILLKIY